MTPNFFRSEDGAMTVLGLFLFMTCCVIGGLALDVANAYKVRTNLQATADSAAHAALYIRDSSDEATAKAAALAVAERMMPNSKFGNTIDANAIHFGIWNAATREFQIIPGSDDAVMVDMGQLASRANPVATYFLSFAGIHQWDVRRGAVYETYRPNCLREGMVAQGRVDAQSNNIYTNGYCIHSQTHVEVNSNNFFDTTVSVTMPDERDLVIPSSGMTTNTGLQEALGSRSYQLRILNQLPAIMDDLEVAGVIHSPGYILPGNTTTLTARNVDASHFTPGAVHTKNCSGNQKIFIQNDTFLENVVLVTDCKVQFGSDVVLENVIIATRNTDKRSFNAASTLTLGLDDDCDPGRGVQLLTFGGVDFAADLHMYGSQILALGDIAFAANAFGIEGANFVAGGEIDGTSNATFGTCAGNGMEDNFEADYFRLAS